MMTNPLQRYRPETSFAPDLREWCEEHNRRPITRRMGRWYYVQETDGVSRAEVIEGTDGENIHRLLDGNLSDFAGWPPARMKGYRSWLQSIAEQGMANRKAA
jgi:hypothetical protein